MNAALWQYIFTLISLEQAGKLTPTQARHLAFWEEELERARNEHGNSPNDLH